MSTQIPSSALTIGIDIGGTKILGGVVDSTGKVIDSARRATPAAGGMALVATVIELIKEFAQKHEVAGVGISIAALISSDSGRIFDAPNIANLSEINFVNEIKKEIFSWMRGQPEGYRNFKEIKEEPRTSEHFYKLVGLVLKKCYRLPYDNVQEIVKDYFSSESFNKSKVPLDFIPRFKNEQFDPKNTGDEKINSYIKANYEIAVVAAYKDGDLGDMIDF